MRLPGLFAASLLLALPLGAWAHGGPPLRLAVVAGDSALAHLVLSHLRDDVGYAVEWKRFPDAAALRRSLSEGAADLLVGAAVGESRTALESAARCYFPPFPGTGRPPSPQAGVAVARGVLADLRFTILGREIERLLAALAEVDIRAVQDAEHRGGERAAAAAARAVLAAKGLR